MKNVIEYSDEVMELAESIVNANTVENPICIYYITLGQSGNSKDVRFVLYRLNLNQKSQYVNPFTFQCILGDDLIESCHKAKSQCGNIPIVIDFNRQNAIKAYTKWTPDVVRFGKNYGLKLSECEDKFVIWVAKGCPLYNDEYQCWENRQFGGEQFMLEAQKYAVESQIGVLVDNKFFSNEQYKKYQEKQALLNSLIYDHHDSLGLRVTKTLTVINVTGYDSDFGYTKIITFRDDLNRVYIYKGVSFPVTLNVGESAEITGTIKYNEYKGQKQTLLQRVKVLNYINSNNQLITI